MAVNGENSKYHAFGHAIAPMRMPGLSSRTAQTEVLKFTQDPGGQNIERPEWVTKI